MSSSWVSPGGGIFGRLFQYVDASHVDAVTKATPLVLAKAGQWESSIRLVLGNVSGSIGETSALAIIIGGIFLLFTRVANWRTVAGVLVSFLVCECILKIFQRINRSFHL